MADSTPENWQPRRQVLRDDPDRRRRDAHGRGRRLPRGRSPGDRGDAALGKLLHLLARMSGARRVLEVGTLGGYSTIWLARGIPDDGRVVTLELEQKHADVARANFERAGVSDKVEIVVGRAADSLPRIAERGDEPFDLVFIDADKESNTIYIDWAIRLGRPGTVIVVDNVGRMGEVANPDIDRRDGDRRQARARDAGRRPPGGCHGAADRRHERVGRGRGRARRVGEAGHSMSIDAAFVRRMNEGDTTEPHDERIEQ